MNNKKLKVYLASGWFTSSTREIRDKLESLLEHREDVELYSPLRDGIMLPPEQKHDTKLRERVFEENIHHIIDADLVVANIESTDEYNDPGTVYEIGYAMAHDIPVIGFFKNKKNILPRFHGIIPGFDALIYGYVELVRYLDRLDMTYTAEESKDKVLFVGAGDKDIDNKLASYIMDSGANIRLVSEVHDKVYACIDEIFDNINYMIAVIDDRKPLVSWMIGQAYARGIPVITYSNFNYGINVMLLVSVLTHLRGAEELVGFLQQVKREGLDSIPKLDISQLESM